MKAGRFIFKLLMINYLKSYEIELRKPFKPKSVQDSDKTAAFRHAGLKSGYPERGGLQGLHGRPRTGPRMTQLADFRGTKYYHLVGAHVLSSHLDGEVQTQDDLPRELSEA